MGVDKGVTVTFFPTKTFSKCLIVKKLCPCRIYSIVGIALLIHLPKKEKEMETGNRYNVFNNIHKGLRGMLFDTQIKIQQTDFTSPEAAEVIGNLEQVLMFFDEHADHEDRFILANIVKQEPVISQELENDHVLDHKLGEGLMDYILQWKQALTAKDKALAGQQIFYAFNEFIAFNLYHMNKEENQLLVLLWKHYTDEEIHGMETQILESINPQVLMEESRWMMRSMSVPEIAGWLQGIKMNAPEPVYGVFVQMAEEELPAARFEQLQVATAI